MAPSATCPLAGSSRTFGSSRGLVAGIWRALHVIFVSVSSLIETRQREGVFGEEELSVVCEQPRCFCGELQEVQQSSFSVSSAASSCPGWGSADGPDKAARVSLSLSHPSQSRAGAVLV